MNDIVELRSGVLPSGKTWVLWIAAAILLLTFVGVGWFLLVVGAVKAFAVIAMLRQHSRRSTIYNIVLITIGMIVVVVYLALALLAFKSGNTSLIGALRS